MYCRTVIVKLSFWHASETPFLKNSETPFQLKLKTHAYFLTPGFQPVLPTDIYISTKFQKFGIFSKCLVYKFVIW